MQCYQLIPITQNGERFHVPCGKCNFCLQNRRSDWAMRLMEEEKDSQTAHFLTLTYDQKHVPHLWEGDELISYNLKKKDLYEFQETIKKSQKRTLKDQYKIWPLRYYSVGEYGSRTHRPHYHTIMFNIHDETIDKLDRGQIWGKGHIHYGTVTDKSVNYVAKYLIDRKEEEVDIEGYQKPFSTMSRNPGLGASYLVHNREWHRPNNTFDPEEFRIYTMKNGVKMRLPRYYKDKIFKEEKGSIEELQMKIAMANAGETIGKKFLEDHLKKVEELEMLGFENPEEELQMRKKAHLKRIRLKSLSLNKI